MQAQPLLQAVRGVMQGLRGSHRRPAVPGAAAGHSSAAVLAWRCAMLLHLLPMLLLLRVTVGRLLLRLLVWRQRRQVQRQSVWL